MMSSILTSLFSGCLRQTNEFAYEAPVKKITFDAPFPGDLIYQATPNAKIIVGKKDVRPPANEPGGLDAPYYEISGFEVETGKKLWQLPVNGEIVGQTGTQILIYEEKTSTVHFINPSDGQITRKISPAPNPLTSRNGLELGMAFNDDVYLTTKALYTSVYKNTADWKNRLEDESFQIGITAKDWNSEKVKWFLPPVKQIVMIESRPIILGNKAFIVNPPQTADGVQTYQIVSLETGAEVFRATTGGKFPLIGKDLFIEQTDSFIRRFEPLIGADIWKIEGSFHNAMLSSTGSQITVAAPLGERERTITPVDEATGKSIQQFEFPYTQNTPLRGCFLTAGKLILCNFVARKETDILKRDFNYWVAYDAPAKKVLWRTELKMEATSSLFPFASDKMKIE